MVTMKKKGKTKKGTSKSIKRDAKKYSIYYLPISMYLTVRDDNN